MVAFFFSPKLLERSIRLPCDGSCAGLTGCPFADRLASGFDFPFLMLYGGSDVK
jgi:hypothetical protein